jgi:tRNA-uridine 2-sulfurtransferase
LGNHEGYPFYTIGQRKGLGIALGEPAFVTDIIPETNTVVLGNENDLKRQVMFVGKLNMIKYPVIEDGMEVVAKIRYKDSGTAATLYNDGENIRAEFMVPVKSIAPGQSAVFYEGNDVVAGGIILSRFE